MDTPNNNVKKDITISRIIEAPKALIWRAWTEPEKIKKWWGPKGVIIPECEVDLRLGGKIYIVMEATAEMGEHKGIRWPMLGRFTKIEKDSYLAYNAQAWTEKAEDKTQIDQTTELTLVEQNGKTNLNVRVVINKTGPQVQMAMEGMEYGFNQQLDKLAKFLKEN